MARLFTDGAELGSTIALDWVNTGTTASTTQKRTGVYSYKHNHSLTVSSGAYKAITATSEVYVRSAAYLEAQLNSYKNQFLQFKYDTTLFVGFDIDETSGLFRALVNSAVVATGTITVPTSQWIVLEAHVKIDDSAGMLELKVDGVLDISYTGDTKPSTGTTINRIYWYSNNSDNGAISYFDDLAINDTSGSSDNSWCNDGRVLLELLPNAAGDVTQLTPSSGSNYACVDEVPYNSDTDYVEHDTVDYYDLYNLASTSIASTSTIRRVIPTAIAKDTVASGGKIQVGIKTNSTEYWSDDKTLSTNYDLVYGNEYLVNPSSGSAWSVDDLNALQIGVKIRGT